MAELNGSSKVFWPRAVLAITIFVLFFGLLSLWLITQYEIDSALAKAAVSHCPNDTFFSGRLRARWATWGGSALFISTLLLLLNALSHLEAFPKNNRAGMPWGVRGVYGVCACIVAAIATIWFSDATAFCIGTNGIYSQSFPTATFQKHAWKDVKAIKVDCGYGRHGTETSYVLALKDGDEIDIADAWPMPGPVWPPDEAYVQFKEQLESVPFQFAANIRPACSKNLVNWVSQRP